MKVVEFEKALTVFDDYPDGVDVYYFYIQKKMDNEWVWLWDEDKLLHEEALRKYLKISLFGKKWTLTVCDRSSIIGFIQTQKLIPKEK